MRERCAALPPPLRGAAARPRYGAQTPHQYMATMCLWFPCIFFTYHARPEFSTASRCPPARLLAEVFGAAAAPPSALPPARRVPLHPFNRPSTQRSNARGPNSPSRFSSRQRSMYKSFVLHPFIQRLRVCNTCTPVSRQPTVSSLLKLRRTPHTAWYLEPACSAGRRCCAIATCRERPRSSGMCMAPVLGSGSGELCFAEARCVLCL